MPRKVYRGKPRLFFSCAGGRFPTRSILSFLCRCVAPRFVADVSCYDPRWFTAVNQSLASRRLDGTSCRKPDVTESLSAALEAPALPRSASRISSGSPLFVVVVYRGKPRHTADHPYVALCSRSNPLPDRTVLVVHANRGSIADRPTNRGLPR